MTMATASGKATKATGGIGGAAVANLSGAVVAPLPKGVEPELPTLATAAPTGQDWVHEIKFDGYRILASVDHGKVTLSTRRGNDWTDRMPALATALRTIPAQTALLDGELVVLDARGMSDFQLLQDALGGRPARQALVYYAFDLLYLDGVDLRGVGLGERKRRLAQMLARIPPEAASAIRLSDHVMGQGPAFLAQVAHLGLEGIVSKQLGAPYRSGRSHHWLKVKCCQRQEFVVVGFTDPKGSRSNLGALLVATHAGAELVYRGRVGTGFGEKTLRDLRQKLAPLHASQPILAGASSDAEARTVHWVKPELVAEVSFAGLTRDGLLRHATFLGLREDKSASEVIFEGTPPPRPTPIARSHKPAKPNAN
jgi:bifunctional non-homologous end joining protein LigD